MQTIQGSGRASGLRFAVIVSKYNDFVTDRLQAGAIAALGAAGVSGDDITIVRVPGERGRVFVAPDVGGGDASVAWFGRCVRRADYR